MAIRIRHDTVDPELGCSPYQLVYGRDRPGFGIPWPVVLECREAAELMAHQEQVEQDLGKVLRKRISDSLQRASQGRPARGFSVGDLVWLKRSKGITGPGLAPNRLGPYFDAKQVGQHSFEMSSGRSKQAAHASQLETCVEVGEAEENWECVGGVVGRTAQAVAGQTLHESLAASSPRKASGDGGAGTAERGEVP